LRTRPGAGEGKTIYGDRAWRGGNATKVLYRVTPEEIGRVGSGVPKWKAGDLLIVEQHSGDCFYDYRFVRFKDGALRATRKTAGYALWIGVPIPERVYYKLLAGDRVGMLDSVFESLTKKLQKKEDRLRARRDLLVKKHKEMVAARSDESADMTF
jgi:hypothetical protein